MYQPAFNKIHHIAIIAADYEKSRQFYVDILGFSIIRENHRPEKGDIKLDLKMNEETEIELFIKSDAPKRLTYPEAKGYRHLAIKTTNIEEDRNYLISQGVKVEEIRQDEITDRKMLFFYFGEYHNLKPTKLCKQLYSQFF